MLFPYFSFLRLSLFTLLFWIILNSTILGVESNKKTIGFSFTLYVKKHFEKCKPNGGLYFFGLLFKILGYFEHNYLSCIVLKKSDFSIVHLFANQHGLKTSLLQNH